MHTRQILKEITTTRKIFFLFFVHFDFTTFCFRCSIQCMWYVPWYIYVIFTLFDQKQHFLFCSFVCRVYTIQSTLTLNNDLTCFFLLLLYLKFSVQIFEKKKFMLFFTSFLPKKNFPCFPSLFLCLLYLYFSLQQDNFIFWFKIKRKKKIFDSIENVLLNENRNDCNRRRLHRFMNDKMLLAAKATTTVTFEYSNWQH